MPRAGSVSGYRTIVADPPWPYDDKNAAWVKRDKGNLLTYQTMTIDEIKDLPVRALAARDVSGTTHRERGFPHDGCWLYLWTTNRFLAEAYGVAAAWGFTPTAVLIWCKARRGFTVGGIYASNVEFVLVARRGTPKPAKQKECAPRAHSVKPDAFYDLLEQVHVGPYVELFARRARFGWDYWGDQSLGTAELPETVAIDV